MPSTFSEGEGLDAILQPREGVQIRERQDVRARRQELAQLDERRAQALEIIRQLGRRRVRRRSGRAFVVQSGIEAGGLDQVAPPVLHQQHRHVLVPLEVLWLQ